MYISKKHIEKIGTRLILKSIRIGSDKDNFEILQKLPMDLKQLMKEFNLTKMPMNRRVNQLEECGLIRRERYKGTVELTKLGEEFIKVIHKIIKGMKKEIINII